MDQNSVSLPCQRMTLGKALHIIFSRWLESKYKKVDQRSVSSPFVSVMFEAGSLYVALAILEVTMDQTQIHRYLTASAFQVLGLKVVYATTPSMTQVLMGIGDVKVKRVCGVLPTQCSTSLTVNDGEGSVIPNPSFFKTRIGTLKLFSSRNSTVS